MPNKQQFHVNGKLHEIHVEADQSLLSVLREELDLTGAKYGCGEGQCGACTVLIDGQPTRSCITPAGSVGKKQITTIEGLAGKIYFSGSSHLEPGSEDKLHPVQQAFLDADAMQCGYCTSGMVLSAVALLRKNPAPSESQIITAMQGNVCRCGTYRRIVRAIQLAAKAQAVQLSAKAQKER